MYENYDGIKDVIKKYQKLYKLRLGTREFIPIDYDKEIAKVIFEEQKRDFKRLYALVETANREEQKKSLFFISQLKRNRKRLRKVAKLLRKVELSSLVQKLVDPDGSVELDRPETPQVSATTTASGPTDSQGPSCAAVRQGQNSNV